MEQELDEKLAGWRFPDSRIIIHPIRIVVSGIAIIEPPFTQSLDAIFKWLVPKAVSRMALVFKIDSQSAYKELFRWWLKELFSDPTKPALALCLVIEKLIDEQS